VKTRVIDKRNIEENRAIRRRRSCLKCENRFTSYERAHLGLVVLKRKGGKEKFDKNKLKVGILKACEKRPISMRKIDKLVDEVETEIRNLHQDKVKSKTIGDIVINKLKKIDKVAYVRFASHYRHFNNVSTFKKAI
jgi:transcriptional repressor NrdR